MLIKTKGIVLRTIDYSESSKIVTVFSESHGKLSVIAKGVKSPKSPLAHVIQVMNEIEWVIYLKEGRDVQNVSQAELITVRKKIVTDYDRMMTGFRLIEWIYHLQFPLEESAHIYHLLSKSLHVLDSQEHLHPGLMAKFFLRLSQYSGYEPNLYDCASCNRQITQAKEQEEWHFQLGKGIIYCPDCHGNFKNDYTVSIPVLRMAVNWMFPEQIDVKNLIIDREDYDHLSDLLEKHLRHHTDTHP